MARHQTAICSTIMTQVGDLVNEIKLLQVPKWGLSMEEGTIVSWLLQEGDAFSEGDELCEIETSKTTNVFEAPFSGVLRRILEQPGALLPVGAPLAVSAPSDIDDAAIGSFLLEIGGANGASEARADASANTLERPVDTPAASVPQSAGSRKLTGIGEGGDDSEVFATLHARKFAKQFGVNLLNVSGTGRRGRISRNDVIAALRAVDPDFQDARATDAEEAHAKAPSLSGGSKPAMAAGAIAVEPLSSMRRNIAARLQQAKQAAPHFRIMMDCDLDALLELRASLNARQTDTKISVTDLIVKACAHALMEFPECNIQFDGEKISRFAHADISVAVALDAGLITPIVSAADTKGVMEISREMRRLTEKARDGRLQPEEYEGGTFSISNLGMFGVRQFDAIINPPQCAILAVGESVQRYVPVDGAPTLKTEMRLCLSCDHRVIDGAVAARFLRAIKAALEQPLMMIL